MAIGIYLLFGVLIAGLIFWRVRSLTRPSTRPVTQRRLLIPLIAVVVIICFDWKLIAPNVHYPPLWMSTITAVLGIAMSLPLIYSTNYEKRADGQIYSKPNRLFIASFVGLIILRLLGEFLFRHIDPAALAFLTYILVLAYLVPWRLACLMKYHRLASRKIHSSES